MKKKTDFSSDAAAWIDFANYDLKTAKWNFEGQIYTSACYASQQAAEKALKALLLFAGKTILKVHSLDRLLSELRKAKIETYEIEKEALELDKYYISTRYPGQYGGPEGLYGGKDAQLAIDSASKILEFVGKKI